jgi:hypothetical protein
LNWIGEKRVNDGLEQQSKKITVKDEKNNIPDGCDGAQK